MIDYTVISRPGFVVDQASITRGSGRQIDWANVPDTYKNATTGKKHIPAGTSMSKNVANEMIVPRTGLDVVATPALKTFMVLTTSAEEGARFVAETGYGVLLDAVVYEQLMPGYDDDDWDDQKTELIAAGFKFEKHANTMAS